MLCMLFLPLPDVVGHRLRKLLWGEVLAVEGDKAPLRVHQVHDDGVVDEVVLRLTGLGVVDAVLPRSILYLQGGFPINKDERDTIILRHTPSTFVSQVPLNMAALEWGDPLASQSPTAVSISKGVTLVAPGGGGVSTLQDGWQREGLAFSKDPVSPIKRG